MKHDKGAAIVPIFMLYFALAVVQVGIPLMALDMARVQTGFVLECPGEHPPLTLDQCYQITRGK